MRGAVIVSDLHGLPDLLSVRDAAEKADVHPAALLAMVREYALASIVIDGVRKVSFADVRAILAEPVSVRGQQARRTRAAQQT